MFHDNQFFCCKNYENTWHLLLSSDSQSRTLGKGAKPMEVFCSAVNWLFYVKNALAPFFILVNWRGGRNKFYGTNFQFYLKISKGYLPDIARSQRIFGGGIVVVLFRHWNEWFDSPPCGNSAKLSVQFEVVFLRCSSAVQIGRNRWYIFSRFRKLQVSYYRRRFMTGFWIRHAAAAILEQTRNSSEAPASFLQGIFSFLFIGLWKSYLFAQIFTTPIQKGSVIFAFCDFAVPPSPFFWLDYQFCTSLMMCFVSHFLQEHLKIGRNSETKWTSLLSIHASTRHASVTTGKPLGPVHMKTRVASHMAMASWGILFPHCISFWKCSLQYVAIVGECSSHYWADLSQLFNVC